MFFKKFLLELEDKSLYKHRRDWEEEKEREVEKQQEINLFYDELNSNISIATRKIWFNENFQLKKKKFIDLSLIIIVVWLPNLLL